MLLGTGGRKLLSLTNKNSAKTHSFVLNHAVPYGTLEFSLNGAELSLNSVNSENLKIHSGMNWVQYKDLFCFLWLCG